MKSSDIDQELFTESYCKVCSAQLISESQRVAHYEVGCSWAVTPALQFCWEHSAFQNCFYWWHLTLAVMSLQRCLLCVWLFLVSAKSACNLIRTEGNTVSKESN